MTEQGEAPPNGPRKWSTDDKLRVLAAALGLSGEALGALLRREGLHEAELASWRASAVGALQGGAEAASPGGAGDRRRLEKRVKELERELRRKDKALAEAGALLFLEKKLQAMGWDERHSSSEDDTSDERSDK